VTDSDLAALADAWIANCLAPTAPSHTSDAIFGQIWQLCEDEPERAFQFVLEVLGRDHSDKILEVLSAGPLEEVLARHGEKMIERVEAEARANLMFATLLGGVWQNDMSDEVWRRVQAVWDRRGWDGIPEKN
jgi:Family of unknown function (DUF6869)